MNFQSATPHPDRIHPPPVTRSVLPALTSFEFRGTSEYLEDLIGRIDGPQRDLIAITYLNRLVDIQVAQLSKFIDRSVVPENTLFGYAGVCFSSRWVSFNIYHHGNHPGGQWHPATTIISCEGIDWQVSHIAHVLSQISATLSNVVHLWLEENAARQLRGTDDVEWLDLLSQFSTVQTLYVSPDLAGHVALALEGNTGETVAEVLPSLDLICLVGQPASSVEKFVAARRLSGRPVTVVGTKKEFNERLESYVSK